MKFLPCFYGILDLETCRAREIDPVTLAKRWCNLGVRLIQLRAKNVTADVAFEFCRGVSIAVAGYRAKLLVNDRVDISIALGLDGVHLPSTSLPIETARLLMPDGIIAKSCHSIEEIYIASKQGVDLVTLSPIFSPNSKPNDGRDTLGLDVLKALHTIPVFALGGMTFDRARRAIDCGAYGVAMLGELTAELPNEVAEQIRTLGPV